MQFAHTKMIGPINIMQNTFVTYPKTLTVANDLTEVNSENIYDMGKAYWSASGTYFKNEYVYYGGLYYKCLKDWVTSTPTDGATWQAGSFSAETFGHAIHQREQWDGAVTSTLTFTVTLTRPISTKILQAASLYGFGRNEMDSSHSGYCYLYVNNSLTWSAGETNSGITLGEAALRTNVSSVKIQVYGYQDGGIQPHGAYTGIGELTIYAVL